jgi:hypothetical protein
MDLDKVSEGAAELMRFLIESLSTQKAIVIRAVDGYVLIYPFDYTNFFCGTFKTYDEVKIKVAELRQDTARLELSQQLVQDELVGGYFKAEDKEQVKPYPTSSPKLKER